MKTRKDQISRLKAGEARSPDVLIVGGGANGLGTYRDLALQGVPALLVDKGDFASGTSAAPSRLIHGGLRYLETGEFALVKESVIERNHLLKNAPHLVQPLRVWVPAKNWFGGSFSAILRFLRLQKTPGDKGLLVVKLGLMFFDAFGRSNQSMPNHRLIALKDARQQIPMLAPGVVGVAEYYDARVTHPERLAMEIAGDAEADCPDAMAIPYMSFVRLEGATAILRDEIDGEEFAVEPRMVVNCSGPWVDDVNARVGLPDPMSGGTKGSHIVLRRPDLAAQLDDGMLYFETHDHRACLIYSTDENHVLLGTTDLRTDSPEYRPCSEQEIDYLFGVLKEVLPQSSPDRRQIDFTYAGVRPLPLAEGGATGAISRDHKLHIFEPLKSGEPAILTLVGGKWTTYRACAEQIADAVLSRLGKTRTRSTLDVKIGGGKNFPRDAAAIDEQARQISEKTGVGRKSAGRLIRRYGSKASAVAEAAAAHDGKRLTSDPTYFVGEIDWSVRNERVTQLQDVVLRRTLMAFEGGLSRSLLEELADVAGSALDWSQQRRKDEVKQTELVLKSHHLVDLSADDPPAER